jgi:hypothetical protein
MLARKRRHSSGVKNHCPYITRPTPERIRAFRAVLIFMPSLAAHSQIGFGDTFAPLFLIVIHLFIKFAIIINRLQCHNRPRSVFLAEKFKNLESFQSLEPAFGMFAYIDVFT